MFQLLRKVLGFFFIVIKKKNFEFMGYGRKWFNSSPPPPSIHPNFYDIETLIIKYKTVMSYTLMLVEFSAF